MEKIPEKILGIALKIGEGKNVDQVDRLASIVENQPGIILLDLRRREEKNMTILKFAGGVTDVLNSLFPISEMALKEINFRNYTQEGSAVGSISSIVFIPVRGLTVKDCKQIAESFAKNFYEKFKQPSFYFGRTFSRKIQEMSVRLHQISAQEIQQFIESGEILPNIGEAHYAPERGITLIGVRKFIVTFVLMLDTGDLELAQYIADELGSEGRRQIDENGKEMLDEAGKPVIEPGKFPLVDTLAVASDNEKLTRIVCNLLDYQNPTLIKLYRTAQKVAGNYMVEILGSQLIGYLPQDVLFAAIKDLPKSKQKPKKSFEKNMDSVAEYLILNTYGEFNAQWQIIDFRFLPREPDPDMDYS